MTAFLLIFAAGYAGPQACEPCHAQIYRAQRGTHHAGALKPVRESPLGGLLKTLRERGGAAFRYAAEPDGGVFATAEHGSDSARLALEWVFGAGAQAYTPVGRLRGVWVEHRVSWYRARDGLSLTPGYDPAPSRDAFAALGVPQTAQNIYRCFNCHAAGVEQREDGALDLDRMIPGVTCERCHGPGAAHIEAARAGKPPRNSIFSPARMNARQQAEFCAGCHRSPDSRFNSATPELDSPLSIRFAPVGLMASRCFQKSGRLTCVTCHDPHRDPLPAADPHYTRVCTACHAQTRAHRAATPDDCVQCHMKKSEPAAYLRFTDHRIRIYPE